MFKKRHEIGYKIPQKNQNEYQKTKKNKNLSLYKSKNLLKFGDRTIFFLKKSVTNKR